MEPQSETWETLYRRAVPRVYRALLATLRDPAAAEDALHDAFAEGLRRPPPHDQNLVGWLFRVGLRRARRRRWPFVSLDRHVDRRADADDIDMLLNRLEAGRLLAMLTERQRAVIVAHYYLGLSQRETAAAFGVRPGTVSATLAQALQKMRQGDSHA